MAKSTATSNSILALIFNATTFDNIAKNDTAGTLTNLYVSLHTDTPGVGGSQTTNEADYTGHERIAVARTTAGWSAPASGSTHNVPVITFTECSGGTNSISYVAIGTDITGTGRVLYAGALSSPRTVSTGIQPQFNGSTLVVTET